jgi:hypothetical protein
VYAKLLDDGRYLASMSRMYRVLRELTAPRFSMRPTPPRTLRPTPIDKAAWINKAEHAPGILT